MLKDLLGEAQTTRLLDDLAVTFNHVSSLNNSNHNKLHIPDFTHSISGMISIPKHAKTIAVDLRSNFILRVFTISFSSWV